MKRIITLIVMAMVMMTGFAQNANKSGLYLDFGAGYALGNLPVVDIAMEENVIKLDYPNSFGMVIDLGYRYTQWKQSAVEMKLQYLGDFKKISASSVVKIMPGYLHFFKIGNGRLLYTDVNVGVAFGSKGLKDGYWKEYDSVGIDSKFWQDPQSAGALNPSSIGIGYGLETGLVLGRIWSLSVAWDAQILNQYSSAGIGNRHWGIASVKFGVRL